MESSILKSDPFRSMKELHPMSPRIFMNGMSMNTRNSPAIMNGMIVSPVLNMDENFVFVREAISDWFIWEMVK